MPYIPRVWKDLPNETTPINAESLNAIENYLAKLSTLTTTFIDFTAGSGSGVVCRVGFTCQMNLTILSASMTQPLFTIPEGYHPAINFDTPLIDSVTGMVVGELVFDRVQDTVMFNGTSATLENPCHVTVTYLCD